MNLQQTSIKGYMINWSLMVIAASTWMRLFSTPLNSMLGISFLQGDFYVQLIDSLAFAKIIATISTLIHIYGKRVIAFLTIPAAILFIEIIFNLVFLIVVFVVFSNFANHHRYLNPVRNDLAPTSENIQAFLLMIIGIAASNSGIQLAHELLFNPIFPGKKASDWGIHPATAQKNAAPHKHIRQGANNDFKNYRLRSKRLKIVAQYTAGPSNESPNQGKVRLIKTTGPVFPIAYSISFPGQYQDHTGPPN